MAGFDERLRRGEDFEKELLAYLQTLPARSAIFVGGIVCLILLLRR